MAGWIWFDRFDVFHVLVNLCHAYVPVAFVMMILYGTGDVISHFQNDGCTMHFYRNEGVNRDNIQAIFFASLGAWAIATKVFGLKFDEKYLDMINPTSFFYLAAAGLGIVSVVMTQFGVFTGSCQSVAAGAVATKINGEIPTMELYAGVVFSLLLAFSINHMDMVSYIKDNGKNVIFLYTNGWSLLAWLLRVLFVSFMLVMVDDDGNNSFYLDHGDRLLEAATCLSAIALVDTNAADYKAFEKIELADVTYPGGSIKVEPNQKMVALLWAIVGAVSIEFLMRIFELIPIYMTSGYPEFIKQYQFFWMVVSKVLGLFSDVAISLFIFVLIMSNEIAACPLLDPTDATVETVYWISIIFIAQGFLSGAWKSYTFHDKFTDKAAAKAGMVWGQSKSGSYNSLPTKTKSNTYE